LIGFIKVMNFGLSLVVDSSDDIIELAKEADLVIVSDSGAGSAEADKLGVPRVAVTLQPTRVPNQGKELSGFQKLGGILLAPVADFIMTRPFNKHRKTLGLPKLGEEGIFSTFLSLVPVSPMVFSHSEYWPPYVHLTGYWFASEPVDWSPPADLVAFLESGDPPAIISLGAMSIGRSDDASEASEIIISAIQQTGLRAVIQGWNDVLDDASLPDNIFHAGSVPHSWLMPRGCCVTHHGGFGSTGSGLRSGVPSIVVPHIIDQFLWGQEVEKLGVGPTPIPRKELTVERFAEALTRATQDQKIRSTAQRIGEQIRSENGIETAVGLIETTMAGI
jgi:UDP:flavonoid glycosyltransferase YjiC (YdhE family)